MIGLHKSFPQYTTTTMNNKNSSNALLKTEKVNLAGEFLSNSIKAPTSNKLCVFMFFEILFSYCILAQVLGFVELLQVYEIKYKHKMLHLL